jgi:hypothetical protein
MAMGIRKTGGVYETEWHREQAAIAERGNREHIAKFDRSFNGVMAKAAANGDEKANKMTDITKAHQHRGPHELAASLVQHLHDRLDRHRERHGYTKAAKETPPMTSHTEFVQSVVKQYGILALAKSMVQDQKSYGLDEPTFTRLATQHAQRIYPNDRPDVAFSKLYQGEESVRRACQIARAMPFQVSLEPLQVGGEDAQVVNDPSEAIAQLKQLGTDRWPTELAASQFERALTDPANHKLARLAVPIPRATTSYEWPR